MLAPVSRDRVMHVQVSPIRRRGHENRADMAAVSPGILTIRAKIHTNNSLPFGYV